MPNRFTADQISDSYKEEDYAAKFKRLLHIQSHLNYPAIN